MSTRSSWITGAALSCLFAVVGCGSETDPAVVPGGDGDADGSNEDGSNEDGSGDGSTGDGSTGDGSTGDGSTGDGSTGDGSTGDGSTGACEENTQYVGQLFEKETAPNNGGAETDVPYEATYDAGLAAIVAAGPASGDPITVDLPITGATVIATTFEMFANRTFWIQDGNAALQVYLAEDAAALVRVGSKVSAKVTKLGVYGGRPQITELADFTVDSLDEPVFLDDRTGKAITAADASKLLRITGTLTGEGTACGGTNKCWELEHGAESTITFRSKSTFLATGACVTFVGPATVFDGKVQLDSVNFDWVWTNK